MNTALPVFGLLFGQTKSLFSRWLLYGIGTLFSLSVLSVMVELATRMAGAVAISILGKYAALATASSITGVLGDDWKGVTDALTSAMGAMTASPRWRCSRAHEELVTAMRRNPTRTFTNKSGNKAAAFFICSGWEISGTYGGYYTAPLC